MSKIGRFEFNELCELHAINGRGDSAPVGGEKGGDVRDLCDGVLDDA